MDTVQTAQAAVPFATVTPGEDYVGVSLDSNIVRWLSDASTDLPPYWSRAYDEFLRQFWLENDTVAIAVATFIAKFATIPMTVTALNTNIATHTRQATSLQTALLQNSGIMKGWRTELSKFLTDYLVSCNGAFLLLMGDGPADGPLLGAVKGVYHLDSATCTRTSNAEYPVVYLNRHDNKYYRLHYTRIIAMAHQPSPRSELNGVGRSPISLCINAAREIWRIVRYYEQKMGSRPARQILYVKRGATLEQLRGAIDAWQIKMDAKQNTMFGETLLIAPRTANQELELSLIDMASTPDGFNRQETVMLDSALIAAALGLDLRDFAMGFSLAGQTRADADASVLKGHSKGVATFIGDFSEQMQYKAIPTHLVIGFDYVDDSQDASRAAISSTRATTRSSDLSAGVLTPRVARLQMLDSDELTDQQFNELELADGRLPNGLDVLYIFYSTDPAIKSLYTLDAADPLDTASYDADAMLKTIETQLMAVAQIITDARTATQDLNARCVLAALTKLKERIMGEQMAAQEAEMDNTLSAAERIDAETDVAPTGEDVPEDAKITKAATVLRDTLDASITRGDIVHVRRQLRGLAAALFDA